MLKTALIAFPAVSGTANMHLHQELLALYAHTSIEVVESSEHGCCRSSFYDKVQYCSGELLEDASPVLVVELDVIVSFILITFARENLSVGITESRRFEEMLL